MWKPRRKERVAIALRSRIEQGGAAGEAAPREQRGLEAERGGIGAVRGLGHGAQVDEQAAAARAGDADGVGELSASSQQMAGRNRGADRPAEPGG